MRGGNSEGQAIAKDGWNKRIERDKKCTETSGSEDA